MSKDVAYSDIIKIMVRDIMPKITKPRYLTLITSALIFVLLLPVYITNADELTATGEETIEEEGIEPAETGSVNSQEAAARRRELEGQLTELEARIGEQQQLITEYRSQGQTLAGEINRLNAEIGKINLQIEAVSVSLNKLDQDIYATQGQITNTHNKIETHKEALAESLRNLYEADSQNTLAIILQNTTISDFFNNINDILLIQDNIRLALNDVVKLRQELVEHKQELALEKDDIENLKTIRENQKWRAEITQNQKSGLLKTTKNKESEYQKLLEETRKTAAEIRSQIFRLIGGGELTFEKAYEFARLAEGATGIRAALTLAILSRESLLGQNVGQCNYEKAMHPTRDIPVFQEILKNLNIDPNSLVARVSCPNQHGSYGGAMGSAQFIPSTWAIYGGYKIDSSDNWHYEKSRDVIRKFTGSLEPSNPWNNAHAFVATALYIQDLYESPGCKKYGEDYDHVLPKQVLLERCAASKYYAGKRWWTYRFWYGDAVVEKAEEIQKDIDILNS